MKHVLITIGKRSNCIRSGIAETVADIFDECDLVVVAQGNIHTPRRAMYWCVSANPGGLPVTDEQLAEAVETRLRRWRVDGEVVVSSCVRTIGELTTAAERMSALVGAA